MLHLVRNARVVCPSLGPATARPSGARWITIKKVYSITKEDEKNVQSVRPFQTKEAPQLQPTRNEQETLLELVQARREAAEHYVEELQFNKEQQKAIELALAGRNVFITGAAGTGKTTVLCNLVNRLRRLGRHVDVIAPTWRLALAVNGISTWSYAGRDMQIRNYPQRFPRSWRATEESVRRMDATNVLVIYGVNTMGNFDMSRLSRTMTDARTCAGLEFATESDRKARMTAFGGCQVIAAGDFFQEPPYDPFRHCVKCGSVMYNEDVSGETMHRCTTCQRAWLPYEKWAFASDVWARADFAEVQLEEDYCHRQDPDLLRVLDEARRGMLKGPGTDFLKHSQEKPENLPSAVRLYPSVSQAYEYNKRKSNELEGDPRRYPCRDNFHWNELAHPLLRRLAIQTEQGDMAFLRDHAYERLLELKVGTVVVLLSNMNPSKGLVKGTRGVVTDFVVGGVSGLVDNRRESLRAASKYLGQLADLEVIRYMTARPALKLLPLVCFDNGVTELVYPECGYHDMTGTLGPSGRELMLAAKDGDEAGAGDDGLEQLGKHAPSVLCRTQIPLAQGWAMGLEKAQGLTFDSVFVADLSLPPKDGEAYTALSKARTLRGLGVEGTLKVGILEQRRDREVLEAFYGKRLQPVSDKQARPAVIGVKPWDRWGHPTKLESSG